VSLFLNREELADLTGYRQKGKQAEWLRCHGWRFELDAQGRPRVLRQHAHRMLDGTASAQSDSEPKLHLN
jgi:hypothetical protein